MAAADAYGISGGAYPRTREDVGRETACELPPGNRPAKRTECPTGSRAHHAGVSKHKARGD